MRGEGGREEEEGEEGEETSPLTGPFMLCVLSAGSVL